MGTAVKRLNQQAVSRHGVLIMFRSNNFGLFGFCLAAVCLLGAAIADEERNPGQSKKGAADKAEKRQLKPKITVAKDVTFFTGPLDKDGYVDYVAALNKHYSKGVTPQNNAVVLMYQAFGPKPEGTVQPDKFFQLLGMKRPPANGNYFKSMSDFYPRTPAFVAGVWAQFLKEQGRSSEGPWKADELKIVASWIEANSAALKIIEQAVKRTKSYSPLTVPTEADGKNFGLISALLPGVQLSRSVARVLIARAMLRLGEGQTEAAWNDLIMIRKFGRLVGQGPTIIEALVGVAIESMAHNSSVALIAHTNPDAEQAEKYIADLDRLNKTHPLARMIDKINFAERAMYMDSVHQIALGRMDAKELGHMGDGDFGATLKRYAVGLVDWDIVLRNGNKWYDRMINALGQKTYAKRVVAADQIQKDIQEMAANIRNPLNLLKLLDPKGRQQFVSEQMSGIFVAMLLPAVQHAQVAEDRTVQYTHLLKIALALSAYRSDNNRYPQKLEALKPYLQPIPGDVFKNDNLTYKPTDDGYVVYSIGRNQKDEDGRWYNDKPAGDDVRIRIPIPVEP
jgi:hypothetical protein